jgi:hypothetical protein
MAQGLSQKGSLKSLLCKIRLSSKDPEVRNSKFGGIGGLNLDLLVNGDLPVIEFTDNKAGGLGKQKLIIGE